MDSLEKCRHALEPYIRGIREGLEGIDREALDPDALRALAQMEQALKELEELAVMK